MKEFLFGPFVYEYLLVFQARKSLSLTVMPDLRIIVKSPHQANGERIESFLKRKWFWLEKQLQFFGKYRRKEYKREYISGESLYYLGRQYKLMIRRGKENNVELLRGIFLVHTTRTVVDAGYTKKLIARWYEERIQHIFSERFEEMRKRFEYRNTPSLVIREMKRRWGSFVNKDKIILNPKLVHAPKYCIDYVITHELCHMRYKDHDKKFFKFLNKQYPRWRGAKDKLEIVGALCA